MNTQHTRACLLLVAALLAGCGGGGSAGTGSACSIGGSAGCGGSLPVDPPVTPPTNPPPDPNATVGSVDLVTSSTELASAGQQGGEVTVTALVKTASNVAVSGATVAFSADSGFLAVVNATTDASGKAIATLGTGGSKVNRPIKVTATVGTRNASAVVNVTGTRIVFGSPNFMTVGNSATLSAFLLDSAGQPIAGQAISASAKNGNGVSVSGATDSKGQVQVQLNASNRGSEQITLSAMGASISRPLVISGSDIQLSPAITVGAGGVETLAEVAVGSCFAVDGSAAVGGGTVTLNVSRGTLYSDAACSSPVGGALAMPGTSFPRTYLRSANAGETTVEAVTSTGARGSTRLEFVAPLTPSAWVSVQTDKSVVGAGESSTLIAVVRDGTAANNLVKGATVQFSILADPSGGNLLTPFSAVTGSDGVARAVFVGGSADGGKDGTRVMARIADLPGATATTALTVNRKPLSIQFGTGNTVIGFSDAVLQQDFAVFVSDAAGNPVKDVAISVSAWPTAYRKGDWRLEEPVAPATEFIWKQFATCACANEDVQRRGLYDTAFDVNSSGLLEPGIPLSVVAGGQTDAMGMTTLSLRYPRDRAYWVEVELTVTAAVAGSESVARNTFWLRGVAKDYNDPKIHPPGILSPYGTAATCNIAN